MDPITFAGSTNQVTHLADIFLAASQLSNQGLIIINSKGITVYCEYNHILNFHSIIDITLFSKFNFYVNDELYDVNEENNQELRFGVDLSLINHAFDAINSKDVTCYFNYNGEGSPFIVEFEDSIMSESIEFLTFYLDIIYPYDELEEDEEDEESFNLIPNYNLLEYEVLLKSEYLINLLQDLYQINTNELLMYLSNEPELTFISSGPIGLLKLIYPNDKTILEKLMIFNNDNFVSKFNFTNFIKIFKGVKLSSKCKIIKDDNGVFSIQLICKDSNFPNYSGSLITYNMLELANDRDVDYTIFNGSQESLESPNVKRHKKSSNSSVGVKDVEIPLFL